MPGNLSKATSWGPRVAQVLEGPGSARGYSKGYAGRMQKTPAGYQQRRGMDLNRVVVETELLWAGLSSAGELVATLSSAIW